MKRILDNTIRLPWFGIPRIWNFIRPYRMRILGMLMAGAMASGIGALYPLFNRYAIDHFIADQTTRGIVPFVILYVLMLAGQTLVTFISSYSSGQVELFLRRDIRNSAFEHLQNLSVSYFDRNEVGDIHARIISDTDLIGEIFSWRLMNFIWSSVYLVGVFIVMLAIDARLAGYILLFAPGALILIMLFQKGLHPHHLKIRELNARITKDYNEGITGAKAVKVLGIEEKMIRNFRNDTDEMFRVSLHRAHYSVMFLSVMSLMSSVVLAFVLWKGGMQVRENIMRIGTLSVFVSYALEMISPMQDIVETMAALVAAQVNIERVSDLLNEPCDVSDSPSVIMKYGDSLNPKEENWEPLAGDIEFRDVTFRYPNGRKNILEHFDLKVPQGSNIAIVGETGAGKTTLVNLICRFYEPTGGSVLIDGRDIRERSQLWLHRNMGYVLQTPHLFAGTIRDNLRYGKPEASDEEIMEALKLVAADSVVDKFKNGLDSCVGEGGVHLSTGEKQLLSFARAILSDPKILVFDEATSSVDTLTEKVMQRATDAAIRGRTSFVIAHRLSTVTGADLILVIRDGKVVESATHAELMQKKGYYYRLYTSQYEDLAWLE